jgi:mRNA-degrading endonuclease RelE of RelBE toxin-antitoxin system
MNIVYLESFQKDLKKIKNQKLLKSLKTVLLNLETVDSLYDLSNVKKLAGHPEAYRIRIGDYRLGLYYSDNIVIIARLVKRNDIYKLFP